MGTSGRRNVPSASSQGRLVEAEGGMLRIWQLRPLSLLVSLAIPLLPLTASNAPATLAVGVVPHLKISQTIETPGLKKPEKPLRPDACMRTQIPTPSSHDSYRDYIISILTCLDSSLFSLTLLTCGYAFVYCLTQFLVIVLVTPMTRPMTHILLR